jgi:hypothetical protein
MNVYYYFNQEKQDSKDIISQIHYLSSGLC